MKTHTQLHINKSHSALFACQRTFNTKILRLFWTVENLQFFFLNIIFISHVQHIVCICGTKRVTKTSKVPNVQCIFPILTDLIHCPVLSNFPEATHYPDIMDALRVMVQYQNMFFKFLNLNLSLVFHIYIKFKWQYLLEEEEEEEQRKEENGEEYRPYALTSRLHNNDAMLGVKSYRAARTCCTGRAHWRSASVSARARASPAVWHAGVGPLAACLAIAHVAVTRLTPNTRGRPSVTSYAYGL